MVVFLYFSLHVLCAEVQVRDIVLLVVDERVVVVGVDGGSVEDAIVVQVVEHGVMSVDESFAYHGVNIVESLYLFSFRHADVSQVKVQFVAFTGHGLFWLYLHGFSLLFGNGVDLYLVNMHVASASGNILLRLSAVVNNLMVYVVYGM
jgi:hypothetical protein